MFILKPMLRHFSLYKKCAERNLIRVDSLSGLKMIFILLIEIITDYIQAIKILFKKISLERLF